MTRRICPTPGPSTTCTQISLLKKFVGRARLVGRPSIVVGSGPCTFTVLGVAASIGCALEKVGLAVPSYTIASPSPFLSPVHIRLFFDVSIISLLPVFVQKNPARKPFG